MTLPFFLVTKLYLPQNLPKVSVPLGEKTSAVKPAAKTRATTKKSSMKSPPPPSPQKLPAPAKGASQKRGNDKSLDDDGEILATTLKKQHPNK